MTLVALAQYPPSLFWPQSSAMGMTFFVRSTGLDINEGVDPAFPLQSVTEALTRCVAGRGDTIVLMNNTSAHEAAFPIVVNIDVHIIGLRGSPWASPSLRSDSNTAVFRLTEDWIEIGGIELSCADQTGSLIDTPGTPQTKGYWWIHHCLFAAEGAWGRDGILITATDDAPQCVIEDNIFNGGLPNPANGLARDGIRMEGNMTRSIIRRNIFRHIDTIAINCMVNGGDIGAILDNKFMTPDLATGEAITMALGCGNAFISGNEASGDDAAVGFCPYRDLSVGGAGNQLNAWGINYADITPTLPVIV